MGMRCIAICVQAIWGSPAVKAIWVRHIIWILKAVWVLRQELHAEHGAVSHQRTVCKHAQL